MQLFQITPLQLLRITICHANMGLYIAFFSAVSSRKRLTGRLLLVTLAVSLAFGYLACGLFMYVPALQIPITFTTYFLVLFYVFRQRGFAVLMNFFFMCAIGCVSDLITGVLALQIFTTEVLSDSRVFLNPVCYFTSFVSVGVMLVFTFLYSFLRFPKDSISLRVGLLHSIRPVCLILSLIVLYWATVPINSYVFQFEIFVEKLPLFIALTTLLIIGGSYVIQDIHFLQQASRNSALLHQQETQDALLQETRVFRHNIANLLYGFQGMLLSRDQKSIDDYYSNLVNTCALINNENVVSLKRIPSLPVTTLLLNKIQAANEENIPFYVFTDEKLTYHSLKDKEMCEILGILLDNALESARNSPAPLITVEFHNSGDEMEIVVRNTFDDDTLESIRDDVSFSIASTKENHTGLGLETVRRIVGSHHDALFNLFVQGRYVEASLLLNVS